MKLSAADLFKYVCPFVTTWHERIKNCSDMIFSASKFFFSSPYEWKYKRTFIKCLRSRCAPFFGLDQMSSFEIIHTQIDDRQFLWYYLYVWSQILKHITGTKILFKFQIVSKLPSVKSSACLSELTRTEFEGSVVPID